MKGCIKIAENVVGIKLIGDKFYDCE